TGWDIMFFWVARMVMSGYEWAEGLLGEELSKKKGVQPFNDVYFTGMVRDEKRRKMSKSLGNSPDALKLIERYGADGVRFGMLLSGSAGNDIIFDAPIDPKTKAVANESAKCEQGLKFCNKMWNAMKLLKELEVVEAPADEATAKINHLAQNWLGHKLNKTLRQVEQNFAQYRLSDALMNLYTFIWNDFFSEYLEMIKPAYQHPIDRAALEQGIDYFETLMTILHPFMPFVTEEIWHRLKDRSAGQDCIVSTYPGSQDFDDALISQVDAAIDIISKIRFHRKSKGMKDKDPLKLYVRNSDTVKALFDVEGIQETIMKRAYISELIFTDEEEIDQTISFVSGTDQFLLEMNIEIDVEAEVAKLGKDLIHAKGFVTGIEKKLSNERFVNNAPAAVVDKERKKLEDGLARIKILEESLAKLQKV
ncbi:MAG: class I tRNA ligase family protein, partial [Bacteroidota bacterium]